VPARRRFYSTTILTSVLAIFARSVFAADFHYPLDAAAAEKGEVYIADLKLPGILAVRDDKLETYFAASKKFGSPLNRVRCVAVDRQGKLLAGDSATREVYRFDEPGKPTPLLKGAQAGIGIPMSIAVDSKGTIFVTDLEAQSVWRIPAAGGAATRFAEVPAPRGLAIDGQDRLWVVSGSKDPLVRITPDGKLETIVAGRVFQFPHDVAVDKQGTAYVSDGYAKTIWKLTAGGKPDAWIKGAPLVNPVGLGWRGETLLIADPNPKTNTGQVYQADSSGKLRPLIGK
jgi:sugar lactone lactonase YvrE